MTEDFLAVVDAKRFLGREFLTWLVYTIEEHGGRQRMKQVRYYYPGQKPYRMVYCEDPFGNIIEIYHQRIFTHLPAKGLVTDIECEARGREQIEALVAALREKGYSISQVELN